MSKHDDVNRAKKRIIEAHLNGLTHRYEVWSGKKLRVNNKLQCEHHIQVG